jgi:4-hydroxybenzoyl-CoA thioesterase
VGDRSTTVRPRAEVPRRRYRSAILIRFSHCDPAGIVFFPRYLEMFNDLVEDWCRDELHFTFSEIHRGRGWGLPTVHLDVDFIAPSVIGETLAASLSVRAVGKSSMSLAILLQGPDGHDRVRAEMVVVLVDPQSLRAVPIPEELRGRILAFHAAD